MLKPLTLSVSLAVALGACSVVMAGHHGGFLASSQGVLPTAQGACGSPQGYSSCEAPCAPKKHCSLLSRLHKPKCYTYEWVLKKKRVRGGCCGSYETCSPCVYPTSQCAASPQGGYGVLGSGQYLGASQLGATAASQYAPTGATQYAPSAAPAGDEAPPAPPAPAGDEGMDSAPPPPPPGGAAEEPQSSLLFLAPSGN